MNKFAANSRVGAENKKREIILQMTTRNQSNDAVSSYCAKENTQLWHIRDYTKILQYSIATETYYGQFGVFSP